MLNMFLFFLVKVDSFKNLIMVVTFKFFVVNCFCKYTCIVTGYQFIIRGGGGGVAITLTDIALPHSCVCLQTGSGFPTLSVWSFKFNDLKWLIVLLILVELLTITVLTFFCFVDIGGIVDHHCLNFLLFC